MGKAVRLREQNTREKIAAQRAAAQRTARRRRLLLAGGSTLAVLAIVGTFAGLNLGQSQAKAAGSATDASVVQTIASVPQSVFAAVGTGSATGVKAISGAPPLSVNGRPELLYMGGEYCPFCAAERWAIAAALSRFGTLSASSLIHSSPTDVYPNTPTLSFASAGYSSQTVAFTPVEWFGQATDPSTPFGHVYLQQPTAAEQALFSKYAGGAIPFIDIANRYVVPQAQYAPSDLAGLTWQQIASAMKDPASKIAKDIDGAANYITAALIKSGAQAPAGVASSAGVRAAMAALGS